MAEERSDRREDGKRFTDVSKEPDKFLSPLQKFSKKPSSGLEQATKAIEIFVDDLSHYVTVALQRCKSPKDGLTLNESAALYLYSLQWPKEKHSFYTLFNRALRNEDRTKLLPYQSYLHLFLTALQKLPSINDRVWRGVNGNISEQYKLRSVHVWWGASSCSNRVHVTDTFLDQKSHRTLFNIHCSQGKTIKNHSAFPEESEVVLPPGTCLKVRSVSNPAPKLHLIEMEEISYAEPAAASAIADQQVCLVWLDASVKTSRNHMKIAKDLEELHITMKTFEHFDPCDTFIEQTKVNSRIIFIVSGRFGREILPDIHELNQLRTVLVFCQNKTANEGWAKGFPKVKAVMVTPKELLQRVKDEIDIQLKEAEQSSATETTTTTSSSKSAEHSLLEGCERQPLASLEEALQPVSDLLGKEWKSYVFLAKKRSQNPENGLTIDESAAILIYTMEWEEQELSLHQRLNRTLQNEDRSQLQPWFFYLKLILTAFQKLPSYQGTVWRSVQLHSHENYLKGQTYTWWNFSTTTTNMEVFESTQFMSNSGARTLFSIQCEHGKAIYRHSHFHSEDEILLLPGFHFEVLSRLDTGNDLTIINIQEIQSPFPLLTSIGNFKQ